MTLPFKLCFNDSYFVKLILVNDMFYDTVIAGAYLIGFNILKYN